MSSAVADAKEAGASVLVADGFLVDSGSSRVAGEVEGSTSVTSRFRIAVTRLPTAVEMSLGADVVAGNAAGSSTTVGDGEALSAISAVPRGGRIGVLAAGVPVASSVAGVTGVRAATRTAAVAPASGVCSTRGVLGSAGFDIALKINVGVTGRTERILERLVGVTVRSLLRMAVDFISVGVLVTDSDMKGVSVASGAVADALALVGSTTSRVGKSVGRTSVARLVAVAVIARGTVASGVAVIEGVASDCVADALALVGSTTSRAGKSAACVSVARLVAVTVIARWTVAFGVCVAVTEGVACVCVAGAVAVAVKEAAADAEASAGGETVSLPAIDVVAVDG